MGKLISLLAIFFLGFIAVSLLFMMIHRIVEIWHQLYDYTEENHLHLRTNIILTAITTLLAMILMFLVVNK